MLGQDRVTTALTAEQIKDKIGIDDLKVRAGDTGEYYWATLSRRHDGHHYVRSKRVANDATQDDLDRVREAFEAWWDDEKG